MPLQRLQQRVEDRDDEHVVEGDRQHRLHDLEVLGVVPLSHEEDLRERDDRDERCQLDDGDELVAKGRESDPERLRDDDEPLRPHLGDAEHMSRLILALSDGKQGSAMDLRDVGGLAQDQGDQAGEERCREDDTRLGKGLGQVIDEDQENQQRQAAEEPYVECRRLADGGDAGLPSQGDEEAQNHADHPAQYAQLDYRQRREPEVSARREAQRRMSSRIPCCPPHDLEVRAVAAPEAATGSGISSFRLAPAGPRRPSAWSGCTS